MSLTIAARQNRVLRWTFTAYNPAPGGDPDTDSPYDMTGWTFTFQTSDPPGLGYDLASDQLIFNEPNQLVLDVPADETAAWDFRTTQFELEAIPDDPDDTFVLAYGVIVLSKQVAA